MSRSFSNDLFLIFKTGSSGSSGIRVTSPRGTPVVCFSFDKNSADSVVVGSVGPSVVAVAPSAARHWNFPTGQVLTQPEREI